jgi:hypothetical protein
MNYEILYNDYSKKFVVRWGHMPMHLGGEYGKYDPKIGFGLLEDAGKVLLFETREAAEAAMAKEKNNLE